MAAPKEQKKKGKRPDKDPRDALFQSLPGLRDILPKEEEWWRGLSQVGQTVADLHDFHFIETGFVEFASLFEAAFGSNGRYDAKSLYPFKARNARMALRPSGIIGVMRSYLEHHLGYFSSPLKVFFTGPAFRLGGSDTARMFHEFGFEVIGDNDPVYDGEILTVAFDFLRLLKFKDLKLSVNTVGCRVCKPNYQEKLKVFYQTHRAELCRTCSDMKERDPMGLFMCTVPGCRALRDQVPIILDYLCQNCNNHFKTVLELIEDNGILYEPNPFLVREFDFYARTVFDITMPGFAFPLASGGRYDYLAERLHGRMIPAMGVEFRLERVIEAMRAAGLVPHVKMRPRVFCIAVGDQAKKASLKLMGELRTNGITVAEALGKKTLKGQMKIAEKLQVPVALLFGQKEVFEGTVIVRDMRSGAQETVVVAKLVEEVKRRLK